MTIGTGVRIYEHDPQTGKVTRKSYNYATAMIIIRFNRQCGVPVTAVGSEGLAMAIHYNMRSPF